MGSVLTNEHKAGSAKRLLCRNAYSLFEKQLLPTASVEQSVDGPGGTPLKPLDIEVYLYNGDGTQQQAIERKKMHVGYVASLCLSWASLCRYAEKAAHQDAQPELEAESENIEAAVDASVSGDVAGEEDAQAGHVSLSFTEAAGIFQADDGSAMPSSAQASGVDDQVVEARPEAQASKELVMDTDTYCCCDLQVQVRSTGEETYMLVERRRSSVGCP